MCDIYDHISMKSHATIMHACNLSEQNSIMYVKIGTYYVLGHGTAQTSI